MTIYINFSLNESVSSCSSRHSASFHLHLREFADFRII